MNKNTFGGSKAAEILYSNLIELGNPKITAKIGKFTSEFNLTLKELKKIDSRIALGLARTAYNYYLVRADNLPESINTFYKNVISAKFGNWLEEMDSLTPYKFRDDYMKKRKE